MPEKLAVTMMLVGPLVMLLWRYFELKDVIYEIAPGILAGLAIFVIGKVYGLLSRTSKVKADSAVSK